MDKPIWMAEFRQNPKNKKTTVSAIWRPLDGTLLRIAPEAAPAEVREMLLLDTEHGNEPWDGKEAFVFDFQKLKKNAGKETEFFKTVSYRKNNKKYDKDLVAEATFEGCPVASRRISEPTLAEQLHAAQRVAMEVMKAKFPKGLAKNANLQKRREFEELRTAVGLPRKPTKDEKPTEQWSYCAYCGNAKVPDRSEPCASCSAVLRSGTLSVAWEVYQTLEIEHTQCCGGLSTDKTHLHFHGKNWDCTYPKDSKGPSTTVEMGVNLHADCATTYWIFDGGNSTESQEYGNSIKYTDPEFWSKLMAQVDRAAEEAWNSDVCTCESCGEHYYVGNGPCGCVQSEDEEE